MSEIIQVVPPLTQAVIDTKTGLPTKAMADFMHQLSMLATVPDPATAQKINDILDRFDGTDESISGLVSDLLALAEDLKASVLEWNETRQNDTESFARSVKLLTAALNENQAAIIRSQEAKVMADEALASYISTLSSTVGDNAAAITDEATARATADEALASDISTLSSTVGDNAAAITDEATARATADEALASDISTLSSTVGEHTTTLTEFAETIDGITGTWGVQVDVNGYVSGIKLIGENDTSEFNVLADKFSVISPDGTEGKLIIQNNTLTLYDQNNVVRVKIGNLS